MSRLASQLDGAVLVLTPTEANLDGADSLAALYEDMVQAAAPHDEPRVVIDFRHVRSIGAEGVRMLLNYRNHLQGRKGRVLLCELADDLADVFFATRLAGKTPSVVKPFTLAATLQTALDHFTKT